MIELRGTKKEIIHQIKDLWVDEKEDIMIVKITLEASKVWGDTLPRTLQSFMTPSGYANILNHFGKVICHLCRRQIRIKNRYVRRKTAGHSRAKQYHMTCAKKVNII